MKTIDRLIMKATGTRNWVLIAFVRDHGDTWTASYTFWDGIPGERGPCSGKSEHKTREEASASVERAVDAFPYPLAAKVIVTDDYCPEEGGGYGSG